MKTVVLDDDPTGTQCAADVTVLLDWDAAAVRAALVAEDAVYLQTNSRALDREGAVALATRIRDEVAEAAAELGEPITVVLRGDSTLRGHIVAETAIFAAAAPVLFVPAFPDAGRRTIGGVHRVVVDGVEVDAGDTEFARDPIFGYRSSRLDDFAHEIGADGVLTVPLAELRATDGDALDQALSSAAPGVFVVPDITSTADLRLVAAVVRRRRVRRDPVVIRCAAPLAAMVAGCYADRLLGRIPRRGGAGVLVVCGSHTAASTAQLRELADRLEVPVRMIDTDTALRAAAEAARPVAEAAKRDLAVRGVALIASDRTRRATHGLDDAARVMGGIVATVRDVADRVDAVVTKGGITAAEVVRAGLGARAARVVGPAFIGVPVWRLGLGSRGETVVIVPGNVGGPDLLASAVAGALSA